MKIQCEKAILQEALSDVIRAVASKSPSPALEGFLLKADDNLEVTGYNSEIGIRTTVSAQIITSGSLVLPAKLTHDIIRSLPDDIVTIKSDAEFMTSIRCGASLFNIIGLNPQDFPELPILYEECSITINSGLLKSMINGTLFAASDNENNPVMTGCKFDFEEDTLTVVALDYFRMAIRREKILRDSREPLSFVVPAKALRELERFLTDSEEEVRIAISKKNIAFTIGSIILSSQLLQGEFINYKNVLPKTSSLKLTINTQQFIRSLERTLIIIHESVKNDTEFLFEKDTLQLTCTTALGRAYDECPIETLEGEPLRIGFNSRYLLDALRVCRTETVRLELGTELSPCLILPIDGDSFIHFIMPRRLSNQGN